jgi:hypothetical protein
MIRPGSADSGLIVHAVVGGEKKERVPRPEDRGTLCGANEMYFWLERISSATTGESNTQSGEESEQADKSG